MKKMKLIPLLALLFLTAACSSNDTFGDDGHFPENTPENNGGTSGDDLEDFDIVPDTSDYDETPETVPTDETDENYDDFVENSTFTTTVTVQYAGNTATVTNPAEGVTVTRNGAHVTINSTVKKIEYILTGTSTDGSFKIYSDNKFKLTLNGVNLTNPTGAAINIQSKKRAFLISADGTSNTLTDGTSYNTPEGEDLKACLFSEGQIIFSGTGTLGITGNCKNALCSDDYLRFRTGTRINITANAKHGIKANDNIIIGGGVLNIQTIADASKGLSCDGDIRITGGRTTVITSGGGVYEDNDVSGCAGIKCDGTFTMDAGTLALKSTGAGGKGLSTDKDLTINGGTVKVITTGQQYIYGNLDTSPKGIKSDANLTINGGEIKVRTSGGENSEGIESKATLTINGGNIEVSAYDDALNASDHIAITGGNLYAYSSGNDGIDSNGTLTISGGTTVASGTRMPEDGIDCDQNTFIIDGGTVIGIGGSTSVPTAGQCRQPSIIYGGSGSANTYLSLADSGGANILIYKIPRSYSQMTVLISSPSLKQNAVYTLSAGGQTSGGENFHGLIRGGAYTDGSQLASFTLNTMVTTYGFSGGMGGGPRDGL